MKFLAPIGIFIAMVLSVFGIAKNDTLGGATVVYPEQGGTGTSTIPALGEMLIGNASGTYSLIASSTLGGGGTGSSQWIDDGSDIYYALGDVQVRGIGTTTIRGGVRSVFSGGIDVGAGQGFSMDSEDYAITGGSTYGLLMKGLVSSTAISFYSGDGDGVGTFNMSALSADRLYAFPDKDGTIAMTDDITAGGEPLWNAASTTLTVSNFATNTISQWYNDAGYVTTTSGAETDPIWTAASTTYLTTATAASTYLALSATTSLPNLSTVSTSLTGVLVGTSGVLSAITNNSSNWDTAYTDRLKWDGGATDLVAATGRTSLGLGSMALATTTDYASIAGANAFTATNTFANPVGIGTTVPAATMLFDVWYGGAAKFQFRNDGVLNISNEIRNGSMTQTTAGLRFGNPDSFMQIGGANGSGSALNSGGAEIDVHGHSSAIPGALVFRTGASTTMAQQTERARLDQYGNFGLGVTSASALLHVVSTTEQLRLGYDSSKYTSFTVASDGALTVAPVGPTTTFSSIVAATGGNSTDWNTAYTDRLKWDGGATGLTAATGRTSLGLGTMCTEANTGTTTIATVGTVTAGTWNATAISSAKGGTGLDTSGWTGMVKINGGTWSTTTLSKTINLINATTTDSAYKFGFFTDTALTITKVSAVISPTSTPADTVGMDFNLIHDTTLVDATGNNVFTASQNCQSTTTPIIYTTFADATVPANSHIWLAPTAASSTQIDNFIVTVFYTKD